MIGDILRRRPRPRRRFLNFFPFRPTHCRTPPNLLPSRSMVALNFETTTLNGITLYTQPRSAFFVLELHEFTLSPNYAAQLLHTFLLNLQLFLCMFSLYHDLPTWEIKDKSNRNCIAFLHCTYFHSSSIYILYIYVIDYHN